MPRRLETGPLLVILGALLVLVALFLPWYTGELTAWDVFEVWDLVLAAFAVAAIAAAIGLLSPDVALVDRRWLPATVLAAVVVVAAEILEKQGARESSGRTLGRVPADLLDLLRDAVLLVDVRQHLGHERDTLDRRVLVEGRENLARGSNANEIAWPQWCFVVHPLLPSPVLLAAESPQAPGPCHDRPSVITVLLDHVQARWIAARPDPAYEEERHHDDGDDT